MQTTQEWVKEKVLAYNQNPKELLEDMLSITNDVIEQYINSPNIAQRGLLESCLEHNKLFLLEVGIIEF